MTDASAAAMAAPVPKGTLQRLQGQLKAAKSELVKLQGQLRSFQKDHERQVKSIQFQLRGARPGPAREGQGGEAVVGHQASLTCLPQPIGHIRSCFPNKVCIAKEWLACRLLSSLPQSVLVSHVNWQPGSLRAERDSETGFDLPRGKSHAANNGVQQPRGAIFGVPVRIFRCLLRAF